MNYEFERLFKDFKVLILNFLKGNGENSTIFGIAGLWPRIEFWASLTTKRRIQDTYIFDMILTVHRR